MSSMSSGELFDSPKGPYETHLRRRHYQVIAGVDEVGRGCIAGPVVAAAVILRNLRAGYVDDINDSKKVRVNERERLAKLIRRHAVAVGVGVVDNREVDAINILQASFKAMRMALAELRNETGLLLPDFVLVDGHLKIPLIDIPQMPLIQGDGRCKSIGAASIVAKVFRDGLMRQWHEQYPHYHFHRNKGYGTAEHWAALRAHGPCELHRLSFRGVLFGEGEVVSQRDLEPV
jgi:ribonuclease HII